MHNAPSHAARHTTEYLQSVFARHGKIMQWPACSPDLNPVENLWSILKRKLYSGGRQYTSKDDLWNAVLTAAKDISSDDIESLTSSMDQRLFSLIYKLAITVGAKSMSPVDIKLLLGSLYNITALHHNTNIFSIEIK